MRSDKSTDDLAQQSSLNSNIPAKAGRREWIGLAVIALPCMIYSMDLTVLNLAVPEMARALNPSASQLLWIIDIYGFMVAGFLMVMGAMGDRIGRKRLLLIGAFAFGIASVVAAFSQTAEQLILARALLGVAGATLAPSTLSLLTNMFLDEKQRTFAISMWIMSFSVGGIIGPIVGGVMIEYFWWGSVFLVAVPPMILLLVLGPFLLPEHLDPNAEGIDIASAALSLLAVLAFIYGVKNWAENGMNLIAAVAIVLGCLIGYVFFKRQKMLENPLVDMGLFRSPIFSLSLAINGIALFFLFGAFIFIAQYLQLVAGLSPLQAGLWSLPAAIAFTAASPFIATLADRFSAVTILATGLFFSTTGFAMMAMSTDIVPVVISSVIFSIGFTPVVGLTIGFIVGSAPVEKAGVVSAISETSVELGGALGIAALGSLMTSIYRLQMSKVDLRVFPEKMADNARTTLAGAVEAASRMEESLGVEMLETARSAFMTAFHITGWLAAIALLILAFATLWVLREKKVA
ncbi:MAG: MFS transporter [Proteobacteria bacterium]|nr:MFS transporter [Pseudomonadota bacterium]